MEKAAAVVDAVVEEDGILGRAIRRWNLDEVDPADGRLVGEGGDCRGDVEIPEGDVEGQSPAVRAALQAQPGPQVAQEAEVAPVGVETGVGAVQRHLEEKSGRGWAGLRGKVRI